MLNRLAFALSIYFLIFLRPDVFSNPLLVPNSIDSTLTCNGSLGNNIFTDGDFGSGARNTVGTNPQIAPGYNYTATGPPNDGFYVLTNNTGAWANLFPTWLSLRDNSSDPNGYFMVVNASFDPGLFYEKQVDGLCSNTQYEFSVDIINLIKRTVPDHIDPNVDMLLDNQVILSTGQIGQNEEWNHYSVSFCTGPNQSSMKLSLRNNAPGGRGNDLALDNISFRPCGPEALISPADTSYVCKDDTDQFVIRADINNPAFQSVLWQRSSDNGQSWQNIPGADQLSYTLNNFASGTFLYRYLLATDATNLSNVNCRLISAEKTVIVVPILYQITDTICDGNIFPVGNSNYTLSGTYLDSLVSSRGCDSIVTTNLTVLPDLQTAPIFEVSSPNCFEGNDGSISVTDVPDGKAPFLYILNGTMVNTSGVFDNLEAGSYKLEVLDKFDCSFSADITVLPPIQQLHVEIPEDTSLSFGESLILSSFSSQSNVTYTWSPAEGLSCDNCASPLATPAVSSQYTLIVEDDKGCTASDSIRIEIVKANFLVHAPTAFTPNADGQNDVFHAVVRSPGGIKQINQFSIFNRWGKRVFASSGPVNGQNAVSWDGMSQGSFAPQGVYVYVIEFELIDGRILQYSGSISVLR